MSENPGIGFSFKLGKKKEKFAAPIIQNVAEDVPEFITGIDEKEIKSTKASSGPKEPPVIPLIQNNNWRSSAKDRKDTKFKIKQEVKTEDGQSIKTEPGVDIKHEPEGSTQDVKIKTEPVEMSLEEKARLELVQEAQEFNDEFVERSKVSSNRIIPILMANRVPNGFEEDENFDVSVRAEDPTADDYEKIPVEEFGMAMLRGMGFKPEDAVNQIEPLEVKIRPKGLGLGAEIPKPKVTVSKVTSKDSKPLEMKAGAHVLILGGKHKDFYGTIQSIDDEVTYAMVKLAINGVVENVLIAYLQLVDSETFKKESKVINRSSYTKYKKDETSNGHESSSSSKVTSNSSPINHGSSSRDHSSSRKELTRDQKSPKHGTKSSSRDHRPWLAPNLRVRIVDKKSRHDGEKVIIDEVLTPKTCNCRTDRGKRLENMDMKYLETVVPRDKGSKVLILRGDHKNEIGQVLERNRDRHEASVQLVSDPLLIVTLHFDDICEYVSH